MTRSADGIPQLKKRNGVYNVVWSDPAVKDATGRVLKPARSRRIGLRTRDPMEAQARYAALLVEGPDIFKEQASSAPGAALTVSQALDDYMREHVRAGKVADPVRQENAIHYLRLFFGESYAADIDVPKCIAYADARRAGRLAGKRKSSAVGADATIRREMVVLRAAIRHAAKWRRIGPTAKPPTAMPTFEIPEEPATGDEAPWLTKEQVHQLLLVSEGWLHHFIKLAYWWGARRGWVERLHISQVNFETGRVNPYLPGERITKKRRVILPIFRPIAGNLAQLAVDASTRGGYLFGGRPDSYHSFWKACMRIGIPEGRRHPHVLRHSRATHMLMDGESIYKVARLLGDTVATVERVYGHHSAEYLAEKTAR